jgi:CheY-like chemotaxis protein
MAKILVVEDEPSIAEIIAANLEVHGHEVVIVSDGLEALQVFDSDHFGFPAGRAPQAVRWWQAHRRGVGAQLRGGRRCRPGWRRGFCHQALRPGGPGQEGRVRSIAPPEGDIRPAAACRPRHAQPLKPSAGPAVMRGTVARASPRWRVGRWPGATRIALLPRGEWSASQHVRLYPREKRRG